MKLNFVQHFNAMLIILLLFFNVITIINGEHDIIKQLRTEFASSKKSEQDSVLPYLCMTLGTPEAINAANANQEFISSLIDELGFGALGLKPNSWAAKYKANRQKRVSCYSAFYSMATTEKRMTPLASLKHLIRRCCLPDNEL